MDTVILAAGRGERLNGIAAPYHKPLLPVNGKPLIRQAVELTYLASEPSDRVPIIVAAPENALPITQVLDGLHYEMVIQSSPRGPGHALLRGLRLVTDPDVMVLMSDNVFTYEDICKFTQLQTAGVGVRYVDRHDAERFTRIRKDGTWVEKVPVRDEDLTATSFTPTRVVCWVGPLKIDADVTRRVLSDFFSNVPLGPPVLNAHHGIITVEVDTYDIGVPEAWNGKGET